MTFDRNTPADSPGIVIPVEGLGLRDEDIFLNVSGTVPLTASDYGWLPSSDGAAFGKGAANETTGQCSGSNVPADLREIGIKGAYVKRLRTGDRLEVLIGVKRPAFHIRDASTVAYAHRTFTLYDLDDYRKNVEPHRIPPSDIQAFPLPEDEARYMFGYKIAQSYFVVRLTIRNSLGEDKLVNIGLISATGRAIVEPVEHDEPTYTVPVKVSPQGPVQVFAVLDETDIWRERSWVFRGLDFVGTLATAGVNSFKVASEWRKYVSLYTGVGVPEGRKLWPDEWPGYKRNLVTFSMPELTKIPKQSTSSPRYVFFAKRDLELIVSDPALFERAVYLLKPFGRTKLPTKGPAVRVISLAFDNLEIPFEDVVTAGTEDTVELLGQLQDDVERQIDRLTAMQKRWDGRSLASESIPFAQLKAGQQKLSALAQKSSDDLKAAKLDAAVGALNWLATDLAKADTGTGEVYETLFHDTGSDGYGISSLRALRDELRVLNRRALANSESQPLIDRLHKIQQTIQSSGSLADFVDTAIDIISGNTFTNAVVSVTANLPKSDEASDARDMILHAHATLLHSLVVPVFPLFSPPVNSNAP